MTSSEILEVWLSMLAGSMLMLELTQASVSWSHNAHTHPRYGDKIRHKVAQAHHATIAIHQSHTIQIMFEAP